MRRRSLTPRYILVALASLVLAAPVAHGAFPGTNGEIAFVRGDASSEQPEIFLMDADGSNVRPLVENGFFGNPSISPDGTTIAFDSPESGPGPRHQDDSA